MAFFVYGDSLMKVSILSYDDCDMQGILGAFASPGIAIEKFCETRDLNAEEKREILRRIAESFATTSNRYATFTSQNFGYRITELTVQE